MIDRTVTGRSARSLTIVQPDWLEDVIDYSVRCNSDAEQVALAIRLAKENVEQASGGPFGAAVFEAQSGRLVSVGVNLVEPYSNVALHAEVVALMFAGRELGTFSLASPPHRVAYVLATSCAPCAMCLGAVHWTGVSRVVAGATREDATAIGFDEGPVFPESLAYLERNGTVCVEGVQREAARAVLERYVALGRAVYNG